MAKKAWITSLIAKVVQILIKYLDFSKVFLEKKASILLKITKLNQYIIKL